MTVTSQDSTFTRLYTPVGELALSRFKTHTPIQEKVIPLVLKGRNVLIIAPTGTGKTESAMLPIFSKLKEKPHKSIACLYITPMKSLNRDLQDRLMWWCNKLELDISIRHGDTTQHERKLQLEYPPQILVTTPEQIQAMLIGKKFREHLRNIKYIIIDEIHEIVQSKRGVQLTVALERLKNITDKPQIIALSATIGSPETVAKFLFNKDDYELVQAQVVKDIDLEVRYPYPNAEDRKLAEDIFIGETVAARLRAIHEIIKSHKSSLTFTNTREAAEILSSRLRLFDKDLTHEVHHSSLSKDIRIKAEKEFKGETLKALIATSSLELGIDIGSIDVVIQYMSPRQVAKLVQRIGRSGHGVGRKSEGYIISAEGDDVFESAVIARKVLKGELEKIKTHKNSFDVLVHQIIGMLMLDYEIDSTEAYNLIKRAQPFSELKQEDFERVLKLMEEIRLIYRDKNLIKRKKKVFDYYFQNLSVIPDTKNYKIIEMGSNSFIGVLDEEFVVNHGSMGSTFIVKGRSWKILSVENDKVIVEAVQNIESSVPAWNGELIPVPYEISQEVGELRELIAKQLRNGLKTKEVIQKIKEKYPVSDDAGERMVDVIEKQLKKYPIPSNDKLLFETYKEYVVIHSMFGTLVNETISRFISSILSADYGEAIFSKCDPYRIIFRGCRLEDIKKIFKEYNPDDLEVIVEKALPRSSLFKYRFLHIAKRMGILERGADLDKINIDRLIDIYWGTPATDETFNELYKDKLDTKKAVDVLKRIKSGEIKIEETEGVSPLGEAGFKFELSDVVKPKSPEKEIFKLFKERLLNTKIRLMCLNCGKYSLSTQVRGIKDTLCPKCGSRLIAILRDYDKESQNIIKKWLKGAELTKQEEDKLEYIKKSADLVINYGSKAAFVLAGRGVGPATAFRILAKANLTEEELLKNILHEERLYIQNKKFWT
ncbi:MAG: DEAD/DEAH box helicase, partial [Candidatus Aenigmarchaeota archaeon]|nr:DEAD/DEAH box helicase [Candidatus Aenigmarchaeota archaeon]